MVLFMWVFNPNFGLINSVLKLIGIQGPGWFSDPAWSLPAVIIESVDSGWQHGYLPCRFPGYFSKPV